MSRQTWEEVLALAIALGLLLIGAYLFNEDAEEARSKQAAPKRPVVTLVDNTFGRWPGIREAARAWSASPHVEVVVSSKPRRGTYNVYINLSPYITPGQLGLSTNRGPDTATIDLSTNEEVPEYLTTPEVRTAVIAHEIGHVLGIPEPDGTGRKGVSGVLAGTEGGEFVNLPTEADLALLREAKNGEGLRWGVFAWADQH